MQAIEAGVDAVGFVCAEPASIRTIKKIDAASIAATIPPPINSFVLNSETTASEIAEVVRLVKAHTVQVVSDIGPNESEELARLIPSTHRVQVIHIQSKGDLQLIDRYAPFVHAFLLNSGKSTGDGPISGGTGRVHDWSLSAQFVQQSPLPVFLAGGLSAENVGRAIRTVRPFGVDLCSGARSKGRLDPDKLTAFVQAVRMTDDELRGTEIL